MPGVVFLNGESITLWTIENEDGEVIQRARNEPSFRDGFLIETPTSQNMVERYIEESIEGDDDSINLLICSGGDAVGAVSLLNMQRSHGMLHYWVLPDARGNGYATEASALLLDHAFNTVGLHRVYAWAINANEASQAILRRLGFTHEGTYREHVFIDGSYRDTEHYGILDSEWKGAEAVLKDS